MVVSGEPLEFTFNGARISGIRGDTVATALARNGEKVFSRSMKFRRPRGLYCGSGRCISCVMRLNGVPGVRTCSVPLEQGMVVETERGFPSTRFDALSIFDTIFRREFDYHSRFIRPAFLAPLYQNVVRRLASSSRVPDSHDSFPPLERRTCEVLIVGRGLSGSIAQARFQKAGVRSLVIADRQVGDVSSPPCTAFAFYESGEVGLQVGRGVHLVKAKSVLLATGRAETGLSIANGDIPGNMLPEAVNQLTSRGIRPGSKAVLVGTNELADRVRRQLDAVRTQIVAEIPNAESVVRVLGGRCVAGIEHAHGGAPRRTRCDLVVQLGPLVPSVELGQQAGCELQNAGRHWAVKVDTEGRTSAPGVFACGGVTGLIGKDERIASGETVALSMLRRRGSA